VSEFGQRDILRRVYVKVIPMPRILVLAVTITMLVSSPSPGQDWARKMFEVISHDFGTIARGAKAEYEFVLTNLCQDDVHVAGVRVTCGCTTARVEKETLKTYEKGSIIAKINSQSFFGHQASTITVTIDKPSLAEVQLHVKVYIRSDVVLDPPSALLGSIDRGTEVEKTVSICCSGRPDWRIVEVKSPSPHLLATVVQTGRSQEEVSYQLRVRLQKNAPAGNIREHLVLVTNDREAAQIPVLVEGQVLPEISVSPASLFMGVVKPGEKVTRQIVIRGKKPFRITAITPDCECIQVGVPAKMDKKSVCLVPVTFVGRSEGHVTGTVQIETDASSAKSKVSVYAAVMR